MALSVKVSIPVSLPKAIGVKVMLTLQLFFPASVVPQVFAEIAKSPLARDAADIERARACVFQRHRLGRAGRADRLVAKTQRVRRDHGRWQTSDERYRAGSNCTVVAIARIARIHVMRSRVDRRDAVHCRRCGFSRYRQQDRGCIDTLGQHSQIGHAIPIEVARDDGKRTQPNLAYGRSGGCHCKCSISGTDEKNNLIIVVIDSCNIDLAVVVEIPHLKTVEFD